MSALAHADQPTTEHGEVASEAVGPNERGDQIRLGSLVSRYRIETRIGMGGGGVVYAAHDQQLDRRVALKVLWPGTHDPAALMREARALAALSHPNILPIYDVGIDDGRSFIVMELIEGGSMVQWIERTSPTPAAIVDALSEAARGLAHAHEHGFVHRDFKLDNVLVCADPGGPRRVLVTDFGLVMHRNRASPRAAGTRPYMAPEQHRGQPLDAATDQYAWCVALFRALYGVYPFEGDSHETLVETKLRGHPATPPGPRAPRAIHTAMVRGLSPRPADRFESMGALVAALAAPRRRWWLVALGLAGAAAALAAMWPSPNPCLDEPSLPWSADEATRLREVLGDNKAPFASETATRVETRLAEYAGQWTSTQTEVCQGLREPSPVRRLAFEAVDHCLRRERLRFAALTQVLSDGDPATAEYAVPAAEALRNGHECLERPAAPSADHAPVEAAFEARLARAEALRLAGRFDDAVVLADEVVGEAAQTEGAARASARAHLERGRSQIELAQHDQSRESLEAAHYGAVEAGDDETALDAATTLLMLSVRQQPDAKAAAFWDRTAQSLLPRATPDQDAMAALLYARAEHALSLDHIDDWLERHTAALTLRRRSGYRSLSLADSLEGLGRAKLHTDKRDAALALFSEALEIRKELLGPQHPWLAVAHNNYGIALAVSDHQTEALTQLQAGLDILEASMPADHPRLARTRTNLGRFLMVRGEIEFAQRLLQQALATFERVHGPEHRETITTRANLVQALLKAHDHATALEHARQLVRDATNSGQPARELAEYQGKLADAQSGLGEYEAALVTYREALPLAGERQPITGFIELGIARALMKLDRIDEAIELARATLDGLGHHPNLESHLALLLAILHKRAGHPKDALAHARTARDKLPGYAQADQSRVGRIERLIREFE